MPTTVSMDQLATLTRWRGGQHPNLQLLTQRMTAEGLRPYRWTNGPNFRSAPRSHTHAKVLYCVQGAITIIVPDANLEITLAPGDRLDLARGVRYAQILGPSGAVCLESEAVGL